MTMPLGSVKKLLNILDVKIPTKKEIKTRRRITNLFIFKSFISYLHPKLHNYHHHISLSTKMEKFNASSKNVRTALSYLSETFLVYKLIIRNLSLASLSSQLQTVIYIISGDYPPPETL